MFSFWYLPVGRRALASRTLWYMVKWLFYKGGRPSSKYDHDDDEFLSSSRQTISPSLRVCDEPFSAYAKLYFLQWQKKKYTRHFFFSYSPFFKHVHQARLAGWTDPPLCLSFSMFTAVQNETDCSFFFLFFRWGELCRVCRNEVLV